jgi:hypothetical protein
VLPTAAVLASDPNSDPNAPSSAPIVRCVAEARGTVTQLQNGYDPTNRTVVLNPTPSLPPTSAGTPLFLRIWEKNISLNAGGPNSGIQLTDSKGQVIGLTVSIQSNTTLPDGAFWMIAVRPSTPQLVYPERFQEAPQPPDGPKQWMCPLAVIDPTGDDSPPQSPAVPIVHDCRRRFDNLVELTRRESGCCCSISLRPEDLQSDGMALQRACDHLANLAKRPGGAGGGAICLAAGHYTLAQTLQLSPTHACLTIEGCRGAAILQAGANPAGFANGLVAINGADNITLAGLQFGVANAPQSVKAGVCINGGQGVTIQGCQFDLLASGASTWSAGIVLDGSCAGLRIADNQFSASGGPVCYGIVAASGAAMIDQSVFCSNRFTGVTVGILSVAGIGMVRFQDNIMTSCFGGIWVANIGLSTAISSFQNLGQATPTFSGIASNLPPAMKPPTGNLNKLGQTPNLYLETTRLTPTLLAVRVMHCLF